MPNVLSWLASEILNRSLVFRLKTPASVASRFAW